MAGRTEFRRAVKVFHERLLVEGRLGLDKLVVDPLQQLVFAVGERVVHRLFKRVVGVAPRAIDRVDRMAYRAGDAGMRGRVVDIVVMGIVEGAAEKRHGIMAASAEPGRFDVALALERHRPGLPDARQIRGIVERAEMMGAMEPAFVGVLMAFQAVLVHNQGPGWHEVARSRFGPRRLEVLDALLRAFRVPTARIL